MLVTQLILTMFLYQVQRVSQVLQLRQLTMLKTVLTSSVKQQLLVLSGIQLLISWLMV